MAAAATIGRMTPADAFRRHGLATEELERWQQHFLEGAEQALDPMLQRHGLAPAVLCDLYAKIGARGKADATAYAFRHGLT